MFHRIPVAAFVIGILGAPLAGVAAAQSTAPVRVSTRATVTNGRVQGLVRDGAGAGIADASILAVGQTIVTARTNATGRFQMALPPGDYVLRATRDGYLSTYREPVSVQSQTRLERTITLMRQSDAALIAAAGGHSHSDLAWQLRHLTRSALRDGSESGVAGGGSFLNRAVDTSSRLATALFADTDLTGQVNFVTTAMAGPAGAWNTGALPRGIAFVSLGASAGANGDWRVRGAIAPSGDSSWNLLGEYESHETSRHAMGLGFSYSAQGFSAASAGGWSPTIAETRRVAAMFARDRWRVLPGLTLEYGFRAETYDYLADPNLVSLNAGVRARLLPATFATARVMRSSVAPGADEFLPTPANGPWLPPERTFSALLPNDLLRAESVSHTEVGVARELGDSRRVLHVRAFRQQTADQIATLFNMSAMAGPGHYHVARAGRVNLDGWAVGIGGQLLGRLRGELEYARVSAEWHADARMPQVLTSSISRRDTDQLNDLTASLEADFNDATTRVSLVFRASNAFSADGDRPDVAGARFNVQLHQALPYQPTRDGRLELVFAVRTLYRDPRDGGSWYDELLTIGPPLRLMGGIQVRF